MILNYLSLKSVAETKNLTNKRFFVSFYSLMITFFYILFLYSDGSIPVYFLKYFEK